MRLREELRKRNQDLLRDVEHQVGKATPQLWHSYGTFPSGTKHTPEHTRQVEEIAGLLINDELLSELTDYEIGFLVLACHFHDLGMSGTEEDNFDEETRSRVRREHAISVGDRIQERWREFGFPNQTMSEVLAEICKGHRPKRVDGTATWENVDERRIVGPGHDVRVRVVAALVYAADELHIGEDRAPRREEEFNRIESVTSRLHWRRHQALQGPVLRGNEICFDGTVLTPVFENDLRKSLVKAFRSVQELNDQLETSGIRRKCNGITLAWHRKRLWALLIGRVCSDLVPRTIDKIIEDTLRLFSNLVGEPVSISSVCNELDSVGVRSSQIRSSIDDLKTREFLTGSGQLVLCGKARTAQHLFDIAKSADEAESHILDQDQSQHENNLYQSPFGKRYVRRQLMPRLEAKYSVDLSTTGHAVHTKIALESSPTAARIADLIQPPETVLVQSELFQLACLSGICGDLVNDPELILNREYRHSVEALVANAVQRLPGFLLFVKELAIIRGLTHEQVYEATSIAADDPHHEKVEQNADVVSFTITQQFPQNRPEWSMGHLLLARSRSETTISIKNTAKARLSIKGIESESLRTPKQFADKPSYITIGSGLPVSAKTISLRGTISLDETSHTVCLDFHQLSFREVGRPLIMQFTPKSEGVATCKFSCVPSEMTVGDNWIVARTSSLLQSGEFTARVTIEGEPLSEVKDLDLGSGEPSELETRLFQVNRNLPLPWFAREEDVKAIISCDDSQLHSVVEGVLSSTRDSRPTVTTFFLRYSTIDGREYYEEYLGMAPLGFGFNPPTVKSDEGAQAEINSHWVKGDIDIKVESSFREEIGELANTYRQWARDIAQPFPFKIQNDLQFHYCKTRLMIVFHRPVDRQWYMERKVVFGFRPVSKSERYGVEMEYWRSQGDDARTELLRELYQNATAQETEQKTQAKLQID